MIEPIYNNAYFIEPIPEDIAKICADPKIKLSPAGYNLGLPPPNIFIPRQFEVLNPDKSLIRSQPWKAYESPQTEVWYQFDTQFNMPKCMYFLNIYSTDNNFQVDCKANSLADLWLEILLKEFKDTKFLAERADQKIGLAIKNNRVFLNAYGYSDTLHLLVEEIINQICRFKANNKQLFENAKAELVKNEENYIMEDPSEQTEQYFRDLTQSIVNWSSEEILAALREITFDDLLEFCSTWLERVRFEWLVYGNVLPEQAKKNRAVH